jgi:hypothetical protein
VREFYEKGCDAGIKISENRVIGWMAGTSAELVEESFRKKETGLVMGNVLGWQWTIMDGASFINRNTQP